jgi:AraC-like DNA-binding protein
MIHHQFDVSTPGCVIDRDPLKTNSIMYQLCGGCVSYQAECLFSEWYSWRLRKQSFQSDSSACCAKYVVNSANMIVRDLTPSPPTAYFRIALMHFGTTPLRRKEIIEGIDITEDQLADPSTRLSVSDHAHYFRNLSRLFGEGWILEVPAFWSEAAQGEYGVARLAAPTFDIAIDVTAEHFSSRWPGFTIESRRDASARTLIYAPSPPLLAQFSAIWNTISTMIALNLSTLAKGYLSSGHQRVRYQFEGQRPNYASKLEANLDGSSTWGNPSFQVSFPNSLLSMTSHLSDDRNFVSAVALLRQKLEHKNDSLSLTVRVLNTMRHNEKGVPGIDETAKALGLSVRSLTRHLLIEGGSFRDLRDDVLRERISAGVNEGMKPEAVAGQIGYADAASLYRSCRRLFGKSLPEIRRDNRS